MRDEFRLTGKVALVTGEAFHAELAPRRVEVLVNRTLLYLASDRSRVTTGTSLLVDGGWTAR